MSAKIRNKTQGKWRILRFSWPFILLLLVFLSTEFSARHAGVVEKIYSEGIYPVISLIFSSVSRHFSLSIWDIFWVLLVISILVCLILMLFRKIKPGWFAMMVIRLLALLYALFYISWGYNYYRPGIAKRLSLQKTSVDTTLFRTVLDSVISNANKNYIVIQPADYKVFDSLIENEYSACSSELKIGYPNGSRRPKTILFSSLFSKFGVSGYFGPFFNEVHLNGELLPMDYPFVLAHEKAHQFGISSEAEANFVAFVICSGANDTRLRYSAYQSLLLYFLRDAYQMKNYRETLLKVNTNVLTDLRYRQHYYDSLMNEKMSRVQTKANDVYLKANRIETGVRNYDEVVSLAINWYQNQGARAIPGF